MDTHRQLEQNFSLDCVDSEIKFQFRTQRSSVFLGKE